MADPTTAPTPGSITAPSPAGMTAPSPATMSGMAGPSPGAMMGMNGQAGVSGASANAQQAEHWRKLGQLAREMPQENFENLKKVSVEEI